MTTRSVLQLVHATPQLEGEGMIVTRPFPTPRLDSIDPFLLLDRMGPATHGPGEAKGTRKEARDFAMRAATPRYTEPGRMLICE